MIGRNSQRNAVQRTNYKLVVSTGEKRRTIQCFGKYDADKLANRIRNGGESVRVIAIPESR